ncbi:TraR/DksA family transcriptional regulator [Methylomicrobium sp. RS1]|jgi:DnaK suppressor protein|uniref:TraR/DksA family transcriptional regulator n=1 Tax=Candidatus Methylomicrobium oryzae TaxID=2802053 RepID=UPI00192155E0|nr:TraR/DksA family transcriptional regulator [Methylomicrobium sp. RS1]MBL1263586.1 TraR/DksA family transcriptional regulator [Methylomicrobium sp. RS1]
MSEKLTGFQLEQFKNLLHDRFYMVRSDLYKEILSIDKEHGSKIAETVYQAAAAALAHLLAGLKRIDLNHYLSEIKDIEAAQTRIAENQYGICQDCGHPIYFKRLLAFPTAKRCVACQRLYEKAKNE